MDLFTRLFKLLVYYPFAVPICIIIVSCGAVAMVLKWVLKGNSTDIADSLEVILEEILLVK